MEGQRGKRNRNGEIRSWIRAKNLNIYVLF